LVDEVVEPDQLLPRAEQIAQDHCRDGAARCPRFHSGGEFGYDLPLASGLELEASLFGLACSTSDKVEGARAFLEKARSKMERKMNHAHQQYAHTWRQAGVPLAMLDFVARPQPASFR